LEEPYPVIDMREAFTAEFKELKCDRKTYLGRYYIGHLNPGEGAARPLSTGPV
jgi:hypothetical protein